MLRVFAIGLTAAGLALAANIAPFYASSYTLTDLGPVPGIDGGLAYGPGNVLFFTKYSSNQIGEIKPGSVSPDKTVAAPVLSSTGTLGFVPAGFNGAGNLVVGSYTQNSMCVAPLAADGSGTFNIGACGASVALSSSEGDCLGASGVATVSEPEHCDLGVRWLAGFVLPD